MTANTPQVDIFKISKAFERISKGFKGKHLDELNIITQQEFSKIVPSENSDVYIAGGYSPDDKTLGLNVYVSNPKENPTKEELRFEKFMFELLVRADITKLPALMASLDLMKPEGTDNYLIDGIPVHFNQELNDYYMHFVIKKE
jgi:hypothetical protein